MMTPEFIRKLPMPRTRSPSRTSANRRRPAEPPGNGRIPAFASGMLSGLALALVLAVFGYWPTSGGGPVTLGLAPPGTTDEAGRERTAPPAGVRFEFPEMLRDARVLVPYVEEYLQTEPTVEEGMSYLLQAGAFRSLADANRRRAEVLLLDLDARTLEVARQGNTWHRVLVGPFPSRKDVRDAQLRLLEDNIDSIVLRADRT